MLLAPASMGVCEQTENDKKMMGNLWSGQNIQPDFSNQRHG